MGCGIDYSGAIESRAKILEAQPWQEDARGLAKTTVDSAKCDEPPATSASKAALYYCASVLLRMTQALMPEDTGQRRDIVQGAVD